MRRTLRARYVFSAVGDPIADGAVTIEDDRIVSVDRCCGGGEISDLGNAAILPGLVNAHVHLDFSDLTAPAWGLSQFSSQRKWGCPHWCSFCRLASPRRRISATIDARRSANNREGAR